MQRLRYLGLKWQALVFLVFGQRARAMAMFEQMLSGFPCDAYALASKAHMLVQSGDRLAALPLMEKLVTLYPDAAAHHFNLGYVLDELDRHEDAELAFRRATQLDSKLDRAWYGLGLVLIRLRRHDEAVVALKQNTKLQPMSPYGWYQLARVHVDRHEPEEAREIIAHLKRFEPKVAAQLERETGIFVSTTS
jgi:tetratricopeptide (TPR) repeat protein